MHHRPSFSYRLPALCCLVLCTLPTGARCQEGAPAERTAATPDAGVTNDNNIQTSADAYWNAARNVRTFVFDEHKYAIPEKAKTGWTPGVDKQPGQETVETLFTAARQRQEAYLTALCKHMNIQPVVLSPAPSAAWMKAVPRFSLQTLPGNAFTRTTAHPTLTQKAENTPPALRFLSLAADVVQKNTSATSGWSDAEKKALQTINALRIIAGVPPMMAHPACHTAATEHSRWQQTHEQLSHTRPERTMRSFVDRLQAAGYEHPGGECLGGMPLSDAVWAWRADAGHHRILLHPEWRACGIAEAGEYCTFVAGRQSNAPKRDARFTTLLAESNDTK